LDACEAAGRTEAPEYVAAAREFYRRHLCTLDPWPAEFDRSMEDAATHPVYPYMNGPSEFTITGTIRDLDLAPRLGEIRAPTLVRGGRADEVPPKVAAQIREGIPEPAATRSRRAPMCRSGRSGAGSPTCSARSSTRSIGRPEPPPLVAPATPCSA